MIDQATIERIFDISDIVEVISEFVQLKKSGANYKGLSPFVNEKTPSFMVSPSKGIFKDFSSGKGGNVVGFLMEHEKFTYPEALKYLARKYHIEIEEKEESAEDIQLKNERESMLIATSFAQKYFSDQLILTEEGKAIGMSYLKERGFREDTISKFSVGYSPEKRTAFTDHALEKGYKLEYLTKTGLSIDKGDYKFDRFAGRIIFPIHGISGNVIGFGGRILKTAEKTAKYLNSPESEIYHKSKVLYGLFQAKGAITKVDLCYLVEGYTDVISMHQAGIQNVVSSSGTALTNDQIRLIKRFTNNITILYDGDPAGIKASLRGIDMILEEGMNVRVLLFPEGDDPDSFSKKHSAVEVEEFIQANQQDFIKFKSQLLLQDAQGDPVKKANLITDIVRSISVIPEGITRSVFIKECSTILEIGEELLHKEVAKIRRKKYFPDAKTQAKTYTSPVKESQKFDQKINDLPYERELIRLLLQYGTKFYTGDEEHKDKLIASFIIEEINRDELSFEDKRYRQIFEEYHEHLEEKDFNFERHFINHSEESLRNLTADLLSSHYDLSKFWDRGKGYIKREDDQLELVIPQTIISFKNKKIIQRIEELGSNLNSITDMEELKNIQDEIRSLNQIKKELAKKLGNLTIIH